MIAQLEPKKLPILFVSRLMLQLRIQEGHLLKIALNLDLTLSGDGKCPALLKSSGIIEQDIKCEETTTI